MAMQGKLDTAGMMSIFLPLETRLTTENKNERTNTVESNIYSDFLEEVVCYKCIICKYLSESKHDLVNHLKAKHEEDINNVAVDEGGANETFPDNDITGLSFVLTDSSDQQGSQVRVTRVNDDKRPSFLCGGCSQCFDSEQLISEHLSSAGTCSLVSGGGVTLIKNVDQDQEEEKSVKKVENNVKLDQVTITKYVEMDKEERNFKCSIKSCGFYFKTQNQLQDHQKCHCLDKLHDNSSDFKCFQCGKMFDKWKECCTHIWRSHNTDCGMMVCSVCKSYKTMSPRLLAVHHQTHENKKQFACDTCGKTFNQLTQLKNHLVTHLDKNLAELPTWAKPKQCDICQKMFSDSKSLKKHVQAIHSKLKPYICNVCNHKSARKAMLQLHMRQHTGDKPFSCNHCDYKTGDPNSLRRHVRRHTNVKPYKCPFCNYSAIQSTTFKSHLKSKHPDHPEVDLKKCYDLMPANQIEEESVILVGGDAINSDVPHINVVQGGEGEEAFVEISMDM